MRPGWDGPATRALILEAILDLPLGASMREVAARIGRHVNTVDFHIPKLRKSGQVQVVKRGFNKRKVVVPVRVRVSQTEAEWLRLGSLTARVIVVVARGDGRRVTSSEVAKTLRWHTAVARYHLQRAREAGLLEARQGAGYTLARGAAGPEVAGIGPQTWEAVRYIAEQGRPVSTGELRRALDWTEGCANYHLRRATKAGLLVAHDNGRAGGYETSPNARAINWNKGNVAATCGRPAPGSPFFTPRRGLGRPLGNPASYAGGSRGAP